MKEKARERESLRKGCDERRKEQRKDKHRGVTKRQKENSGLALSAGSQRGDGRVKLRSNKVQNQ